MAAQQAQVVAVAEVLEAQEPEALLVTTAVVVVVVVGVVD